MAPPLNASWDTARPGTCHLRLAGLAIALLVGCRTEAELGVPCAEPSSEPDPTPRPISGAPTLAMTPLVLTPNPRNALSVFVSWSTEVPTTAELQFGPVGADPAWSHYDAQPSLEHELLVYGVKPRTEVAITAIARSSDGHGTATSTWTSGSAPPMVAEPRLRSRVRNQSEGGWTLMDLNTKGGRDPLYAAIFDEDGDPVWYYEFPGGTGGGGADVSLTPGGTVLIGGAVPIGTRAREVDLAGRDLWLGPIQPGFDSDGYTHHHAERLEDGNLLTLEKVFVDDTRGDRIVELDPEGEEVWSWNSFDWLPPVWGTDWTHSNWVGVDGDRAWLAVHNQLEIVQIDRVTGEVRYELGPDRDFELTRGAWFGPAHGPSFLCNGNLLLYDNVGLSTTRVVEYAVRERVREVEQVWSYDGGVDSWRQGAWGDAERLPGGNTLVVSGDEPNQWIREVAPDGQIVWELDLGEARTYRATRIAPVGLTRL